MIQFNYHHLYYFFCVAEAGGITKAAESLKVSQPALSAQLKQFEDFLGLKLFRKEGRKILLTEDGHFILSYAKSIFDLGSQMHDALHDRGRRGSLKIQVGVSNLVPNAVSGAILNFIFKSHPKTLVTWVENDVQDLLAALNLHKLDMVIASRPARTSGEEGLENFLLAKIPMVFCSGVKMASALKRIPADLDGVPFIYPGPESQYYHRLQEYFLTHKIKPDTVAEIENIELARRMVLAGLGVSALNLFTVRNAPASEKLRILGTQPIPEMHDTVYVIRKGRKNPHPVVSDVIHKMKKEFRVQF
jgi:LysR family transcriptional activator of nhaA